MDNQRNKVRKIAEEYVLVIRKHGIPVQKAILFGSFAKNTPHKDSDIDICIISPRFGKDSLLEMQLLLKLRRQIDSRIEPIPISSQDYKTIATPLIYEIKKTGLSINTNGNRSTRKTLAG